MLTLTEKLNKVLPNSHAYISDAIATKYLKNDYNLQAVDFLIESETTCEIKSIGQSVPSWGKNLVNTYRVTLKNKNHNYTYTFYDSIKNTEENKSVRYDFYSVLTCLSKYCPESFDDFCGDYGYEFKNESDYIKAKSTHIAVLDELKNLRKLFNDEHLEKLNEIN